MSYRTERVLGDIVVSPAAAAREGSGGRGMWGAA